METSKRPPKLAATLACQAGHGRVLSPVANYATTKSGDVEYAPVSKPVRPVLFIRPL